MKEKYNSEGWNYFYSTEDRGRWPSEELVRFIMGRYKKISDRKHIAILDLGCGEGGNMRFLQSEGFNAFGLDGSFVALQKNKNITQAKNMNTKIVNANFTHLPFKRKTFNCIIEISAIQHNTFSDIQTTIVNAIYDLLREGGIFFSFCLKKESYGYRSGEKVEENTFKNIKEPFCKSKVSTHFFAKQELIQLYKKFNRLSIDSIERTFHNGQYCWKHWIVSAQK